MKEQIRGPQGEKWKKITLGYPPHDREVREGCSFVWFMYGYCLHLGFNLQDL